MADLTQYQLLFFLKLKFHFADPQHQLLPVVFQLPIQIVQVLDLFSEGHNLFLAICCPSLVILTEVSVHLR